MGQNVKCFIVCVVGGVFQANQQNGLLMSCRGTKRCWKDHLLSGETFWLWIASSNRYCPEVPWPGAWGDCRNPFLRASTRDCEQCHRIWAAQVSGPLGHWHYHCCRRSHASAGTNMYQYTAVVLLTHLPPNYCQCMVWYGMVWYDMVWYGMVWYVMVYADTSLSSQFPKSHRHL